MKRVREDIEDGSDAELEEAFRDNYSARPWFVSLLFQAPDIFGLFIFPYLSWHTVQSLKFVCYWFYKTIWTFTKSYVLGHIQYLPQLVELMPNPKTLKELTIRNSEFDYPSRPIIPKLNFEPFTNLVSLYMTLASFQQCCDVLHPLEKLKHFTFSLNLHQAPTFEHPHITLVEQRFIQLESLSLHIDRSTHSHFIEQGDCPIIDWLSKCTNLTTLHYRSSLFDFEQKLFPLTRLQKLTVPTWHERFGQFTDLQFLRLPNCEMDSLGPLTKLKNLSELQLKIGVVASFPLGYLDPLAFLPKLSVLQLDLSAYSIHSNLTVNAEEISQLTQLSTLMLQVPMFPYPLFHLTKLTKLGLRTGPFQKTPMVTQLIQSFPALRCLSMGWSHCDESLTWEFLSHLQTLEIACDEQMWYGWLTNSRDRIAAAFPNLELTYTTTNNNFMNTGVFNTL